MSTDFQPRPGALRYKDEAGEWQYVNPQDPLFSTVTMVATEYWNPAAGWVPIFEDGEGESPD